MPRGNVLLDLIDQNHRVAHDDAEHGNHPEHRDEAEWLAEQQQRDDHADQAERRGHHHHQHARETLQLDHQEHQHGDDHDRHLRVDRCLPLAAFLDRPADFDPVADRQRAANLAEGFVDRMRDVDPLRAGRDVGLHGDGRLPVALPDHAVFEVVAQMTERAERHRAVRRRHRQCEELRGGDAFRFGRAQIDADQLVALAILRDGVAGERHREEARNVVGGHAEFACLLLIDFEAHRALGGLVPVELDVAGAAVGAHGRGDALGDRTHGSDIVAAHAELHGIADRRSIFEARQARANRRKVVA